jgi:uncharacterized protein (DUF1810 family)
VVDKLKQGSTLAAILGTDDWKFKASMTLFAEATKGDAKGENQVFRDCMARQRPQPWTASRLGIS